MKSQGIWIWILSGNPVLKTGTVVNWRWVRLSEWAELPEWTLICVLSRELFMYSIRPTLEIFLFPLTGPCFSGMGRSVGIHVLLFF